MGKSASSAALKDVQFEADELYALARRDFEKGELEGALRKLKPILASGNPESEAMGLAARIYAQLRLFERAKELFQRLVADRPDAYDEMFQLGMVNFESGNPEEAIARWDALLELQPTYPPALFYSAVALTQGANPTDAKRMLNVLLQATAPDNLYFDKAKNLLHALENDSLPGGVGTAGSANAGMRVPAADPTLGDSAVRNRH
jgi:tetratricopeptide (TPR) repeat protein